MSILATGILFSRLMARFPAPIDTFNTRVHHHASSLLAFGNHGRRSPWSGLRGGLGEVVIVEEILTPDQVRALCQGDLGGTSIDLGI